jgi:hypothetical protein
MTAVFRLWQERFARLEALLRALPPPKGHAMTEIGQLRIAPEGNRAIRFTRPFAVPRPLLWRALTEPALVSRWL